MSRRRGDPERPARGRSESPPISTRITRKRMPIERIAKNRLHREVPVLKPPWMEHMSDKQYKRTRKSRLAELEQEAADEVEDLQEREQAYIRRSYRRNYGKPAPLSMAREIREAASEIADQRTEEASRVARGSHVARVHPPPAVTNAHYIHELREEVANPNDPPPPTLRVDDIVREFFH